MLSAVILSLLFMMACAPAVPSSPSSSVPAGAPPPGSPTVQVSFPVTLKDMLGREVTLEKKPVRLVSLAPSNTETLFAIGLGDSLVGVTQYCDFPDEAKSKPKIGGFSTADVEKIVALSPDLVMATRIHEKEVVPALERVGLKVFALHPKTVDEVLDSIMLTGRITGQVSAAEKLVGELRARIKAVTSRTEKLPVDKRPRVLYVNWTDPIKTAGKDTFADDLINKAGGVNVAGDLSGFSNISLESIVTRNPQVIIVSGMGETRKRTYSFVMSEARLGGVEARVRNQVYEIDSPIIERAGPRLVQGLEQVAKYLHP